MSKKSIILLTVLFLVALAGPAWPGALPASFIPEGARWIAHFDMEQFVATRLFGHLAKDVRVEVKGGELNRELKIDWRKDISSLTIFGLGPGEEDVVFAAAGRFDKSYLLGRLEHEDGHKAVSYGAFTLHSTDDDDFFAFVNDGLIVHAESRAAIEKVLDTAAGKANNFTSSKLNAAFRSIASGAFLAGFIDELADMGHEIRKSKIAGKARSLSFLAREVKDSLQVRVQVTADSQENAQRVADIIRGLAAMIQLEEKEGEKGRVASLIRDLQVKLEGTIVRLELDLPSKDIAELASDEHVMDFID